MPGSSCHHRLAASAALAAAACALLAAHPAHAHHPTVAPAPQRVTGGADEQTQVSFDVSTTEVDTPEADGTFVTAAADMSLALGAGFAVRVRLPVHNVDATGLETTTGLGDVVAGAAWTRVFARRWSLTTGLDAHLPTGDADSGLGYGVVATAGHARLERRWDNGWRMAGFADALVNLSAAPEAIVAEQRADVEIRAGGGAGWGNDRLVARFDVLASVPVTSDSVGGRVFLTGQPAFELATGPIWLRAFGALPLRTTRRIDWHAGLGVAYRWQANSSKPRTSLRVAKAAL